MMNNAMMTMNGSAAQPGRHEILSDWKYYPMANPIAPARFQPQPRQP